MNKYSFNRLTFLSVVFLLVCMACTKQADLEKIPDSSLVVLNSLDDAQALLDNIVIMQETPALSEISADNYYIPDSGNFVAVELNAYLWKPDIYEGQKQIGDWNKPYEQVYYANSILGSLPRLPDRESQQANHMKGAALFIRSYAFHNVALQFSNLYDAKTAASVPGIPLRLSADPLEQPKRATVAATYQQIIQDIKEAARWLPVTPDPLRKNRPSVPAAYALLARVYLSMSDYPNAQLYADSCLMLHANLLDYDSIDTTAINPFTPNNEEVLYQSNLHSKANMFFPGTYYIDSVLYQSYSGQDLRKRLYFSLDNAGLPISKYSYSGNITRFSGLAVDEVLLIRAECKARLQDAAGALHDLVDLLKSRWKDGAYTPPAVNTPDEVLQLVLTERRKELVFRGLRWADIRRLNKQGAAITLQRKYRQQLYILSPGDKRYVLPIPPDVIAMNGGLEQNPR